MGRGAIISIGRHAAATLQSCSELEVVAIFERSFYLRHGAAFVCIGTPSIGDGPLNALVGSYDRHAVNRSAGETVRRDGQSLTFSDGTVLNWANAACWTTPSWPDVRHPLPNATLDLLIARSPTNGLFRLCAHATADCVMPARGGGYSSQRGKRLDTLHPGRPPQGGREGDTRESCDPTKGSPDSLACVTPLEKRAATAIAALQNGLAAPLPERTVPLAIAVSALIGLGPGLTPSGDDVLAGALLGLHARGNASLAAQLGGHVTAASIDGTSPLSAAFLRCAIDGETSAPLHQALSSALTNVDWPTALDTLDCIGHTSGWDHLAGFLLARTAVQPRPLS